MKKALGSFALLIVASAVFAQEAPPPRQDINYSIGLLLGQSLTTIGLPFDVEGVIRGIRDAVDPAKASQIDIELAKQQVSEAMQAVQESQEAAQASLEQAYLDEHGKKTGVTTTASGLQYEVLRQGSAVRPALTDMVKVDYVGALVNGTEFDNSYSRGEPAVFPLDQVIPGWVEGIQLMGVGGKFRFTIPSALAYGPEGAGGVIPAYATLVFEVELLSIEPPPAAQ